MSTPNKGYATITTGTRAGLWGDDLNSDVFSIVDSNLGGIVTKSVAGSNITLSASEARNVIVRLTGAQSADVQITNPCIGFYFVENLTTNNFNITVTNGVAGVVVPKGRSTVIADATNGCRIAGTDSFPTGTRMTFNQTTAPTGWTKDTSTNNAAFRLVSGTVSSGGSADFTTVFAFRTPTGTNAGTALSEAQIPAHSHFVFNNDNTNLNSNSITFRTYSTYMGTSSDNSFNYGIAGTSKTPAYGKTSDTGSGSTHTHTFTGAAMDFAVKYVDLILAVKN